MGIPLALGFDMGSALPVDSRTVQATLVTRDAIPSGQRYEGLEVYVISELKKFILKGGILNANWEEAGGSAYFPVTTVTDSGTDIILPLPTTKYIRLGNPGLVSIADIADGVQGQELVIYNLSGGDVTVLGEVLPNGKAAAYFFDTSLDVWVPVGSAASTSGSGSGGITSPDTLLIQNYDDLEDFTGFFTMNATLSAVNPINGTKSVVLNSNDTDTAVCHQTIYVPLKFRGKNMRVSAFCQTTSVTLGSVTILLYDDTNSVGLNSVNVTASSTVPVKTEAQFTMPADCASFIVGVVCSAEPGTHTTVFDDLHLELYEEPVVSGGGVQEIEVPVALDLGSLPTSGSWTTNTTYSGIYFREGRFLKGTVRISLSGAPNVVSALNVNLPSGLEVDITAFPSSIVGQYYYNVGNAYMRDEGTGSRSATVHFANVGTTSLTVLWDNTVTATVITPSNITTTSPFTWASGDYILLEYKVPIVGWTATETVAIGLTPPGTTFLNTNVTVPKINTQSTTYNGATLNLALGTTVGSGLYSLSAGVITALKDCTIDVSFSSEGISSALGQRLESAIVKGSVILRDRDYASSAAVAGVYTNSSGQFPMLVGETIALSATTNGVGSLAYNATIVATVVEEELKEVGVDASPWIDMQYPTSQIYTGFNVSTTTTSNVITGLTTIDEEGSGLFSRNNSNGKFTALKNIKGTASFSFRNGAAFRTRGIIRINGTSVKLAHNAAIVGDYGLVSSEINMVEGDYLEFYIDGTSASIDSAYVSILVTASSEVSIAENNPIEFNATVASLVSAADTTAFAYNFLKYTVQNDTALKYNATTGEYEVMESGMWAITVGATMTYGAAPAAGQDIGVGFFIDGGDTRSSTHKTVGTTTYYSPNGAWELPLTVGMKIKPFIRKSGSGAFTITGDGRSNYFTVRKVKNSTFNAVVTDVVSANYTSGSGTQALNGVLKYEIKRRDTHDAYNITTGLYTVPATGYYNIYARYYTQSFTPSAESNVLAIAIRVDGSSVADVVDRARTTLAISGITMQISSNGVYLIQGQTVSVAAANTITTILMNAAQAYNEFSITKVN